MIIAAIFVSLFFQVSQAIPSTSVPIPKPLPIGDPLGNPDAPMKVRFARVKIHHQLPPPRYPPIALILVFKEI